MPNIWRVVKYTRIYRNNIYTAIKNLFHSQRMIAESMFIIQSILKEARFIFYKKNYIWFQRHLK